MEGEQGASEFLQGSLGEGLDKLVAGGDEFAGLDEVISDITDFDLPDMDDLEEEEVIELPPQDTDAAGADEAEQIKAQMKELEDRYNLALDKLAMLDGRTQQSVAPQDPEKLKAEQMKAKRAIYDRFKSTRELSDDEIGLMEERIQAFMEANGQSAAQQQLNYVTQVVENMYLENEKQRLQNSFDKDTVNKYYDNAMRLVAAGKVPTIEDGILLLDARQRRNDAKNKPSQPTGGSVTQQRQQDATRHTPQPAGPVAPAPAGNMEKLGAKDYLMAALKRRMKG